uniref:Immunoglobulin V-set domain-containing protein n=1 Tax=Anabas testudineus TaxID=64144 RepID=A0A7N6A476_ANATE
MLRHDAQESLINHFSLEGNSVTLSYKYSKKAAANDYIFWYRQYPGKPPEFLLSHTGTGTKLQNLVPRMSFNVSKENTGIDLQISSAAVSDSAVYYCALRPTVTGNSKTLYKNLWSKETENSTTSTRGTHTLFNFTTSVFFVIRLWDIRLSNCSVTRISAS